MDANLLVTFDPTHKGKAEEEVKAALKEVGEEPKFNDSPVDGLFLLKTSKDPKELVKGLKGLGADKFENTFHWVPIDKWCKADVGDISKAMKDIDGKIDEAESWKLDLNKRSLEGKTTDLIIKLTENINKPKVDLKNPQKIIKVEIVGKDAGVALINPDEELDVPKMKG